jgi:hypothetical protein
VVVLPASMWAMIPMFRVLARGWLRVMVSDMRGQLSGRARIGVFEEGSGYQR